MSTNSEFDIDLKPHEISILENTCVTGTINVREYDDQNPVRQIELRLGRLDKNLYIELRSFPEKAGFENITGYSITISPGGYRILKEKGAIADRPDYFTKVTLRSR